MNIYTNIVKSYPKCSYLRNQCIYNKQLHYLALCRPNICLKYSKHQKFGKRKYYFKSKLFCSIYHPLDTTKFEEIIDVNTYLLTVPTSNIAKKILYLNNCDSKLRELSRCASVEEVFRFVRENKDVLNDKYLTQIVFVLSDLQDIYDYHLNQENDAKESFYKNLLNHQEFFSVLNSIEKQLDAYDCLFLSYTAIFLNKLGLSGESQLIQDVIAKLKNYLLNNEFSLDICSRFLRVTFQEYSVRPYFTAIDVIPKVFNEIAKVKTAKEVNDLTICMSVLYHVITPDIINQYIVKVKELVNNKVLESEDYKVVLNILALINEPKWRHKNSVLISQLILLMDSSIKLMNFKELELLYFIFFKNEEPGSSLNTIQRACSKTLHELEDTQKQRESQLKLFASLIYFSSPSHRTQFRNDLPKHMSKRGTLNSLLSLRKIFSVLKISNVKLCNDFWDMACQLMKKEKEFDKVVRLCENYINFCMDVPNFRHHVFEQRVNSEIYKYFTDGSLTIFPSIFFSAFSYSLVFSRNQAFMSEMWKSFQSMQNQLNVNSIFRISEALNLVRQRKNPIITEENLQEIRHILNKASERLFLTSNEDNLANGILVKSAIIRNDFENELIDDMLLSSKSSPYMSSKIIANTCFNLMAPKALIPEVLNKCTEYVVQNKENIIGFNAEKLLDTCYNLNYYPINPDKFFQSVIDIIIRDQERLSGLSFLQTAFSLCYFNELPKTFVKQIFNVEFLDKLDVELANCYFRDIYPQRVRYTLMELNRAVCLEYPEYDVPWFHQKYIEELQKNSPKDDLAGTFHLRVKDYLTGIIDRRSIVENVLTPYGYHINFVIYLDENNRPTTKIEDPNNVKLALLLLKETAFTRFYVRLKGKHELKIRHLEILGYKVKIVKLNDWVNLLFAKERIDYIQDILHS